MLCGLIKYAWSFSGLLVISGVGAIKINSHPEMINTMMLVESGFKKLTWPLVKLKLKMKMAVDELIKIRVRVLTVNKITVIIQCHIYNSDVYPATVFLKNPM